MKRSYFLLGACGLAAALVAIACGSSDDSPSVGTSDGGGSGNDGAPTGAEAGSGSDGGDVTDARPLGDGNTKCTRALAPDGDRHVLVSHPFDAQGNKATGFELLSLSAAGVLSKANATFQMGTALESPIAFTPDGNVALVAQDDGTLGVVRIDASGPVVIHAAFKGTFYASRVVMDPRGDRAYVLDPDTASNHGGVYQVDIACDGVLTDRGLVVPGGTDDGLAFLPGSLTAVLSAGAAFDSDASADTHAIDFTDGGARLGSGAIFPDGGAIVSDVAITADGRFAILADDGIIVGNRVAVAELPSLTPRGTLSVLNPAAVVASPFGNAALILSSDGNDAIRLARYTPDAGMPLSIVGEITYAHGKPELPSFAAAITRGALKGLVLVAENTAVRSVQLHDDAGATDIAKLDFGGDLENIVGVIGAAP